MLEQFNYKGIAGSPAGSKDLHLEEVSVMQENLSNFKSGYAVMLDTNGTAKVSDGSDFYGVVSESDRSVPAGIVSGSLSRGIRRKGIVFVVINGDVSKIVKGTYLKVANDGSFEISADGSDAVGRADRNATDNLVALDFNANFYRVKSSTSVTKSLREKANNNN